MDKTERSKIKRAPKRGHYDEETIFKVLDAGQICHVGFIHKDRPVVIPTIYGRSGNKLFIHGATVSRLIVELEKGIDISLSVALVNGLVLARSAFHHSMNYRSVVVFGKAKLVEDPEKNPALKVQFLRHSYNGKQYIITNNIKSDIYHRDILCEIIE